MTSFKKCILVFLSFIPLSSFAKIEVLFHPHDPTLQKIASWIETSQTVDIAMYNMDVTDGSPIIQTLKSPSVQDRLQKGQLKIRLLFEGYSTPENNAKKMQVLEDIGIDVRYLNNALVKVHHKFAVMDAGRLENSRVVTGSANWSMSSAENYNENILFATAESELTGRFQTEFDRLWKNAQEFGQTLPSSPHPILDFDDQPDVEVFFNSPRSLPGQNESPHVLTNELIRVIQSTQSELLIATTRARLYPVLEALLAAAQRGVKISLLLNQDDYRDLDKRASYLMAHPNLITRVKFYNLKISDYLSYQMHNKFLIADRKMVLTGSFNWSKSSENKHIENMIQIEGLKAQDILPAYLQEFQSLWDLGRDEYNAVKEGLEQKTWPGCEIPQMSLTSPEIKSLLQLSPECK